MVIDCDLVAADNFWQFVARKCLTVDINRRIVRAHNSRPHGCQLVVAVQENSFHDRSKRHKTPRKWIKPTNVDGSRGPDYNAPDAAT